MKKPVIWALSLLVGWVIIRWGLNILADGHPQVWGWFASHLQILWILPIIAMLTAFGKPSGISLGGGLGFLGGLLTTLKSIAITVAAIGVAGICLMLFLGLKKSVEMMNGQTSAISTSGIPRQASAELAALGANERIIVAPVGTTNLPPGRWSEEVRRDRFPGDFRGDYDTLSWKLIGERDEAIGLLVDNEKVLVVSPGEYRPNVRMERVRFMTMTGTNAAKIRIEWIEPR